MPQYVPLSKGRSVSEAMARPTERQGSAYSVARCLKKARRPGYVERSTEEGRVLSSQDCRTWNVHVEGSEGVGTSWTGGWVVSVCEVREGDGGEGYVLDSQNIVP